MEAAGGRAPQAGASAIQDRIGAARSRLADREGFLGPMFLLPAVVYIVGLVAAPFFLALLFSFSDVTTGDPSLDLVGLRNFRSIFRDPIFWQSLRNTLVFTTVSMVLTIILANLLALILTSEFRFKRLIRFFVLLPWTTPVALSAVAWLWMLHSLFSPIDWVLRWFGFIEANVYWLGKPALAMASVIAVHIWRIVPLAAVIIMAGLAAIPDDIKEQARIDGAGFWRTFWEVRLPLTRPVIAVAALFGAILTFSDIAVVFVLTRGGPVNSTQVLPSYAFFKGIQAGSLAEGAAIALFLFPLLLAAAILILRSVRKMEIF
ncbi:MAG TPA: sugar ABC transporter permease [Actinomycetota bacterium]|nr:sugar ABC transporter permease [Actinomycetota bacterium]